MSEKQGPEYLKYFKLKNGSEKEGTLVKKKDFFALFMQNYS